MKLGMPPHRSRTHRSRCTTEFADSTFESRETRLATGTLGLGTRLTGGFDPEGSDVAESAPDGTWLVLATVLCRRRPDPDTSIEVVKVAGDSAVGRDRIQSAPNLRRVHAESGQQHRRRIWWLESEDLGQHVLGRDLRLPAIGLDRILKRFLCRGRHAEAIFFRDVSEIRLLRHGAQIGSSGA